MSSISFLSPQLYIFHHSQQDFPKHHAFSTSPSPLPRSSRPRQRPRTICATISPDKESSPLIPPPVPVSSQASTGLSLSRVVFPFLPSRYDGEIAALALPAIGSVMIDPLLTFVDTLFVGRLGTLCVGAMQPCSSVYLIIFSLAGAIVHVAGSVMVTKADAVKDADGVSSATIVVCAAALVMGVVITFAVLSTPNVFLRLMGAKGKMLPVARTYFRARALAIPASMIIIAADGILVGLKDTVTPLYVSCTVGLINLVLDPLLMFGPPRMGIAGAAYATAIAQWAGLVLFLVIFWRRRQVFGQAKVPRIEQDFAQFHNTAGSVFIRQLANTACWGTLGSLATRLGVVAAASQQFVNSIYLIVCFALDTIGVSQMIMIPRAKVTQGVKVAREIAERSLAIGAQVGFLCAAIFLLFFSRYLPIFGLALPVTILARKVLTVAFGTLPFCAVAWIFDSVFFSVSDFAYQAKVLTISSSLAIASMLGTYHLKLGLSEIWLSMILVFFGVRIFGHLWRFYRSRECPLYYPRSLTFSLNGAVSIHSTSDRKRE